MSVPTLIWSSERSDSAETFPSKESLSDLQRDYTAIYFCLITRTGIPSGSDPGRVEKYTDRQVERVRLEPDESEDAAG